MCRGWCGCCGRASDRLTESLRGLSPGFLVSVFTLVNVLNYLDRGIVPVRAAPLMCVCARASSSVTANVGRSSCASSNPCPPPHARLQGAFQSIGDFIRGDLSLTSTDVQLGLLQSASRWVGVRVGGAGGGGEVLFILFAVLYLARRPQHVATRSFPSRVARLLAPPSSMESGCERRVPAPPFTPPPPRHLHCGLRHRERDVWAPRALLPALSPHLHWPRGLVRCGAALGMGAALLGAHPRARLFRRGRGVVPVHRPALH